MPFIALKIRVAAAILGVALTVGLAGTSASARAETITVGGTGSATPLIERFASAYKSLKPDLSVKVIDPPMGSNGAVRAVLAGSVDLAFPGKPLTAEERAKGGQDWELGRTPFLVVTSKDAPSAGFSLEQMAAIYGGKVSTWPDGSPIRLVLRSPSESDTRLLRELSPAMDAAVEAALARTGMLVAANDQENVDMLENTPGSLGATNLALLQARDRKLSAIPLNGVAPTLANLAQGSYPHAKSIYVVRGSALSPAAQGFLEFVLSASGRAILDGAGYLAAPRQP